MPWRPSRRRPVDHGDHDDGPLLDSALLRQLDFHGAELALVDRELAVEAFADPVVARLMTIPGVDAIAAISIVAAVGDFTRFTDADKLVAYVGLNPKVRQSGNSAPVHGRISKAGRGHRPVGRCILTAPALQRVGSGGGTWRGEDVWVCLSGW